MGLLGAPQNGLTWSVPLVCIVFKSFGPQALFSFFSQGEVRKQIIESLPGPVILLPTPVI